LFTVFNWITPTDLALHLNHFIEAQ
jgi:hypothetical protein